MTQATEKSGAKNQMTPMPAPSMVDELIESVVIKGDLSKLSANERNHYYQEVCKSCGLNALTRPFEYLVLNGKLTLYARKDATDQLRTIHKISVDELSNGWVGDVYVVTVKVRNAEGRTDMATGAVAVGNLKGDALCNAFMKAETKAKRRATLSICGLGLLDETELETIPEKNKLKLPPTPSRPIPPHDPSTGELDDDLPEWFNPPGPINPYTNSPPEGDSPQVPPAADKAGAPNGEPLKGAPAEFKEAMQYELRWLSELRRATPKDWDRLARQWNGEKKIRNELLWPNTETRESLSTEVAKAISFLKEGGGL